MHHYGWGSEMGNLDHSKGIQREEVAYKCQRLCIFQLTSRRQNNVVCFHLPDFHVLFFFSDFNLKVDIVSYLAADIFS